ncbi:MAG: phosphatase PAP2 family protein [Tabrizicola sp.]|nr:phosphatase PAP2 family protein [Tabrizicola sp.]
MKHAGSREDLLKKQRPVWRDVVQSGPTGQSPISLVGCFICLLFLLAVIFDPAMRDLARSSDPSAQHVLRWVTGFGNSAYSLITSLALLCWLTLAKRWGADLPVEATRNFRSSLILLVAAVALSGTVASLAKNVIGRARPSFAPDSGVFDFSPFAFTPGLAAFPSGHATTATACAVVFAIVCSRHSWVWLCIGAIAALSRALLGVHWLTDCLAGMALGAIVTLAVHRWMVDHGHVFRIEASVPAALIKDVWGHMSRHGRANPRV